MSKYLGEFQNKAEVWSQYPSGGLRGEYLKIGTATYQWNEKSQDWIGTSEPDMVSLVRNTNLFNGDVDVYNDLTIGGVLRARIVRGRTASVGLYESESELVAAVPNPLKGQWGLVKIANQSEEDTNVGMVYVCKRDGVWINAGYKAGSDGEGEALQNEKEAREAGDQSLQQAILSIKPITIIGDVTNAADEEDITSDEGLLKFKDKKYAPAVHSGLGRKILRKNIVLGTNILTQEMFDEAHTVYVVSYDFSLNNEILTLPNDCTLEFQGGSISNGTLVGNNSKITANISPIFNGITIGGTWKVPYIYSKWFVDITETNNIKNLISLCSDDVFNYVYIAKEETAYLLSATEYVADTKGYGLAINKSNVRLIVDGDIKLAGNALPSYYVISISEVENIELCGSGSVSGDRFEHDYTTHQDDGYKTHEWGHGINIADAKNISIIGLSVKECTGDGIVVNNYEDYVNGDCKIVSVVLQNCRRNGIYVGDACNIIVNNVNASGIGTEIDSIPVLDRGPGAVVDVEPNNLKTKNVLIDNIYASNCRGGIQVYAGNSVNNTANVTIRNIYLKDMVCPENVTSGSFALAIANFTNVKVSNVHSSNVATRSLVFRNTKAICDNIITDNSIYLELVSDVVFNGLNVNISVEDELPVFVFGSNNSTISVKNSTIESYSLFDYGGSPKSVSFEDTSIVLAKSNNTVIKSNHIFKNCDLDFILSGNNTKNVVVTGCNVYQFGSGKFINSTFERNVSNKVFTFNVESSIIERNTFDAVGDINRLSMTNSKFSNNVVSIKAAEGGAVTSPMYCTLLTNSEIVDNTINSENAPTDGYIYFQSADLMSSFAKNNVSGPNAYLFRGPASYSINRYYNVFNNSRTANEYPNKRGTFADKPSGMDVGFRYFCTDKQTAEGATNGIEIIYKGNNVWVDALGRTVN